MAGHRRERNNALQRRDGFALIIALALMAFVVLLIVSLSTVGRIETTRSYTQRQTALARQQAFYALQLALGQLQDAAGPDRRATARAEILGAGLASQPFWTGVWNLTGSGPRETWLVTDDPADAARPNPLGATGPTIRLVGEASAGPNPDDWVEVPVLSLFSNDTAGDAVETARVAWWTGDEGIKASIQALDTVDALGLTAREAQQIRQVANADTAWRVWFADNPALGEVEDETWLELLQLQQSNIWLDETTRANFTARRHDLTLKARGLLTNPLDGGLKINLFTPVDGAVPNSFGDVFGDGQALAVWRGYPSPDEDGAVPMTPIDPLSFALVAEGEPYVQVAPVLAECALFMSAFHHSSRNGPALRYYIDAEFWNPFTYDLKLVESGDRRALTVELQGLPELTVDNLNKGAGIGPFAIDRSPRADGLINTASWMEFGAASGRASSGDVVLRAGEVYQLQDPDPDIQARGLVKYSGARLPYEAGDRIVVAGFPPEGRAGIDFLVTAGASPGGSQIFRLSNVPYEPFQFLFGGGFPPYDIDSSSVDVRDMFVMAFHYRIGNSTNWADDAEWLSSIDFRQPDFDFEGSWIDEAGTARPNREWITLANRNPILVSSNMSALFPGNEVLFDRTPRASEWNDSGDVRLYDLPVGEPVTLADFRILPFKGLPPLSLGSPDNVVAEMNRAFDRYFLLSTVPSSRSGALEPANTRLQRVPVPDGASPPVPALLEGPEAAEFYVLRGAFNWNSTSAAAWYAQLVQAFEGEDVWRYTDAANRPRNLSAEAAIFRHGRGASYRQEPLRDGEIRALGPTADERRFASFRQGARFLERPNSPWAEISPANDPLFQLATEIVRALQQRGEPFGSLAAMMNDGLLQRAIDTSEINEGFLPHALGALRQSDLVALLGLAPAVRSDTFVIRAMGQVMNPATGAIEGEAWLEAKVQRSVEFVDPSRDPAERPDPVDRGPADARRFEMVSFRWLNPADDI